MLFDRKEVIHVSIRIAFDVVSSIKRVAL